MKKVMHGIAAGTAALTVLFAISCQVMERLQSVYVSLAITFGTICYHFVMRLLVGYVVSAWAKRRPLNEKCKWFASRKYEKTLYRRLNVKRWKGNVPTYAPEKFSLEYHTPEEILQEMCVAEVVHEIIVLLSFVPLTFSLIFGEFPVFLITSMLAACADCVFVILQRYNRPRMEAVIKRMRRQKNAITKEIHSI